MATGNCIGALLATDSTLIRDISKKPGAALNVLRQLNHVPAASPTAARSTVVLPLRQIKYPFATSVQRRRFNGESNHRACFRTCSRAMAAQHGSVPNKWLSSPIVTHLKALAVQSPTRVRLEPMRALALLSFKQSATGLGDHPKTAVL